MKVNVKVNNEGVEELKRELIPFISEVTDAAVEAAKDLVPVDSGNLQASIQSKQVDESTFAYYSDVEYALYVEFGTRFKGAKPYLRPAIDIVRSRYR